MAVDFEIWLHILSNSITLWTNVICDMIEHPEREVYINLSREFYRTFIQQPNRRIWHFTEQSDPSGQRSQKLPKNSRKIGQNVTHKWMRFITQKPCVKNWFYLAFTGPWNVSRGRAPVNPHTGDSYIRNNFLYKSIYIVYNICEHTHIG